MRSVILVPFRDQPDRRDVAAYVFDHLVGYGMPIHVGDSDGEWSRAQAINRAARGAGAWDIALIADADTVHDECIVERASETALEHRGAVVPWQTRHKLNEKGSRRLMREGLPFRTRYGDTDTADPTPSRMVAKHRGGPIVVHREAWEIVGGFDEAFVGWGHEDVAFRVSVAMLAPGKLREQRGIVWHLWHPREGVPSPENEMRKLLYMNAQHNPDALRALRKVPV